jgi:hypothetical protein
MPDERTRALLNARRLLSDISQITSTTDVNTLRQRAEDVLRHYPDDGLTVLIATQSSWLQWPCRSLNALSKKATDEGEVVAGLKMPESIAMKTTFQPSRQQKRWIEAGLTEHRIAQANGRPARERLIRRWNSEAGIRLPSRSEPSKLNCPKGYSRFRRGLVPFLKRLFFR